MMSSLPRPSSLAWGIALLAMVFGGCSSGGGSSKALDPLESAQVVAGVGLGELRIGDPLRSVSPTAGAAMASASASLSAHPWPRAHTRPARN